MKTVQEYFRETDSDKLINYYLYEYPINVDDISDENKSIISIIRRKN